MLKEMIVVEGEHDRIAVRRAVAADIIVTGGFALTPQVIERVRLAQARRGVIVMTDPDYAGEQIRRRLSQAITGLKHAFVPRDAATKGDDVGVENASPEAILAALAMIRTDTINTTPIFAWHEMMEHGLMGRADAADRRGRLGRCLGIGYANAKQFFHRLNAYGVSRAEFEAAIRELNGGGNDE